MTAAATDGGAPRRRRGPRPASRRTAARSRGAAHGECDVTAKPSATGPSRRRTLPTRPSRRTPSSPETTLITHVVLMKLTDRAEAPEVKRRLEALQAVVPDLGSLRVDLDTLGLDGSSDLALVTTHDSPEGLVAYQQHPAHQELLGWLRPRLAGRAAVDYES